MPLRDAQAKVAELRLQQREGLGDLLALGNAIEATEGEVQPYVDRFALDGPEGSGPLPLDCAFEGVRPSLSQPASAARSAYRDMARANAFLLLGAAIDGHPATPALADIAMLPAQSVSGSGRCGGVRVPDAIAQASLLMADARTAPATAAKNDAMRDLLHSAGWQWAAWMLAGFGLLQLCRRAISPAIGVALALAISAAAAWAGRVPWPIAAGRDVEFGREGAWWLAAPAPFVLWLGASAALVLAASPWLRHGSGRDRRRLHRGWAIPASCS